MLFVLTDQNSMACQFMTDLRDKNIHNDRLRFHTNMERLGAIMAYEISKKLEYKTKVVDTPLDKANVQVVKEQPVLLTILRAGIPYFNGFQKFFDGADCGFIGAYRKENEQALAIKLDYLATPNLDGKDVILIDPMLATGSSIIETLAALEGRGVPRHLFIACVVATKEGINLLKKNVKHPHSIWCVAIDEKLNKQQYIVPGLGDAGDLSFGEKF